jgi:hypothetical protein
LQKRKEQLYLNDTILSSARKTMNMEAIILMVLCTVAAFGATYYVDYQDGSDENSGTSKNNPWKHAPGDTKARGKAKSVSPSPGDTVCLKGGTIYRGSIQVKTSGTRAKPIVFNGDGWGKQNAIVDGSEPFGKAWKSCKSGKACGGNPQYKNIYYTDAPKGYRSFQTGLFQDDQFLWYAQDPDPKDPFLYDRKGGFHVIPHKDPKISQTRTSITDPRVFINKDPHYYDGAYVAIWHRPNVTPIYKITGYDPASHTLSHKKLKGELYEDKRDTYYTILNHLGSLNKPGEFFFNPDNKRIYVWPHGSNDPGKHAWSAVKRETGIAVSGKKHVVIEGFRVQKSVYGITAADGSSHIIIRNNEVTRLKANNRYAIWVGGQDMLVENNRVTECQRAVGILGGGKNIFVRGNYVERTSRQGIWFMNVEHGEITNNVVKSIAGTHSNGISLYLRVRDILVAGNRVWDTGSSMTYHGNGDKKPMAENLYFYNNICEHAVNSWGYNMGRVVIINNGFFGHTTVGDRPEEDIIVNNIMHGPVVCITNISNLITSFKTGRKKDDKKNLGTGGIDWTGKKGKELFAGLKSKDISLKAGCPAIDAGIDPTQYLPTDKFPDYNFTRDINGKARPQNGKWDIGPAEFVPEKP